MAVLAFSLGARAQVYELPSVDALGPAVRPGTGPELRGLVQPRKQARLNAPVDGVLGTIEVREGQRVARDAPLAVMQDEVQRAKVIAARRTFESDGDLRTARVHLAKARDRHERVERALAEGAATDWELREARMTLDEARAELDSAQERRAQDETRLAVENAVLDRFTLRAPFDGLVTRVHFDEGATLSTEDVLIEIVGLDELEAVLYLPVERFGSFATGSRYALRAEHPVDREIEATVETVDAVLDPGSRTFRVVFHIENGGAELPAGFHVRFDEEAAPLEAAADPVAAAE